MTYCKVLYKLNTGSYISSYTVPIHHKWIGVCECACGFYFHIKDCMDSYRKGIDEWKWWFYDVNGVVWGTSQDVSDWFCWFVRFGGGWFVALPLVNNNLGESFRPPPPSLVVSLGFRWRLVHDMNCIIGWWEMMENTSLTTLARGWYMKHGRFM